MARPVAHRSDLADASLAAGGTAAFVALARHARRGEVGVWEERLFRLSNSLPSSVQHPVWVVMQVGSLAGVAVVTAAAGIHGRRTLAVRLGVTGTTVWGFCKLVKRTIGRGRPSAHLEDVVVRGAPQTGLGFPSGHVAVACTLAGVAAPALSRRGARAAWTTVAIVAVARQYVGAHLPNDVAGGVAVGVAVTSVARIRSGAPPTRGGERPAGRTVRESRHQSRPRLRRIRWSLLS